MQKLQDRPLAFKGEITVFLSLIFVILISFVGAMIEAASISLAQSMKQADLVLAMESIFAEYEIELLRKYGIFAKQGSDLYSISNRLSYYGAGNLDHEIVEMKLLSDHDGQEFYRQAVTCMGGTVSEVRPSIENPYEEQAKTVKEQFEAFVKEEVMDELPEFGDVNPSFMLALILPREEPLSNKRVVLSELPSRRELETGVGNQSKVEKTISGRWLFASYLTKHFLDYTKHQNTNPLSYETEYLLAGKASDETNLEWVAKRLLSIRLAVNYGYLLTQEEKLAEADVLALGISALLLAPEAKEIVKQALLFLWAYEDSLSDLRSLLRGGKVPLVPKKESQGEGVSYEDYLRALLFAEKPEVLCRRALDLLELNLGLEVDSLVTGLQLESAGYTRRQIRYTCESAFEYE